MSTVHVVVPAGIDDERKPSGGNIYDRRVCRGLANAGWSVSAHGVAGNWPMPDAGSDDRVARVLSAIPDDAVVLVDGLVASASPDAFVPEAKRLRLVVLVHLAFGDGPPVAGLADARAREDAVLSAAAAVITTSNWTRTRLVDLYALRPAVVFVAAPGVDYADLAPGTPGGGEILCVGVLAPHKGQDLLLSALAGILQLPWRCHLVGSLDRDPAFVKRLRQQAVSTGISDRVVFDGALAGPQLASAYANADVLASASHGESYGMVVTEALARGLPVVASDVGGVSEALGRTSDGSQPGLLVDPGEPASLSAALSSWLTDVDLRADLRRRAVERRETLSPWSQTVAQVAAVLTVVGP